MPFEPKIIGLDGEPSFGSEAELADDLQELTAQLSADANNLAASYPANANSQPPPLAGLSPITPHSHNGLRSKTAVWAGVSAVAAATVLITLGTLISLSTSDPLSRHSDGITQLPEPRPTQLAFTSELSDNRSADRAQPPSRTGLANVRTVRFDSLDVLRVTPASNRQSPLLNVENPAQLEAVLDLMELDVNNVSNDVSM